MPNAKRNLTGNQRRAISRRLQEFRILRYRTQQAMNREAGVPHTTASGWFRADPALPDTVSLVRLAQTKNLNLNWLLLGEGEPLRGIEHNADVWTQLRQTLVVELVSHGANAADAEQLIPTPEDLFHDISVAMLEGWQRATESRRGN